MRLVHLDLRRFRNIHEASIDFGPGVNLVLGANGQGKTNLVEAVSFLSWLKSFRTSRSADLPTSGEETAHIVGRVAGGAATHDIEVTVGAGHRRAAVDGKGVRSPRECLTVLAVACLSPDDPAVLEGGPEGRRLLLDRLVVLLRPPLAVLLQRHARHLKERNRLLKEAPGAVDPRLLEATDETLAQCGAEVAAARIDALARLAERLPATLQAMSGTDLGVAVRYEAKWAVGRAPTADALLNALRTRRPADLALGYTTAGPHADDLDVVLQGRKARGSASRGQKKILMLAWKVAEALEYLGSTGETPVLVLDDALADLDPERQERVIRVLGTYPGQAFVTSAVASGDAVRGATVFRADAGTFEREEPWAGS
jgi:DNA replication and repair protein RecF